MQRITLTRWRTVLGGLALGALATTAASAQSRVVLPAGSVLIVHTTTPLQSSTAKVGQTFNTRVDESIGVDEFTVIPAGSTVRGRVTMATPATRQQSGVIDVVFDQLTLPNGTSFQIQGKLTSTDSAERRQINADPNNSHVVLVGERGGIGAAIAGAGSNNSNNAIFTALGSLLSEGRDVAVPSGTPLAVELENSVTLRGGTRLRGVENSTIYTATERIRAAQQALYQLNYYRGPISGQLDDATRQALFQYQVDRGLSRTGNLDGRTARSLGINLGTGVALSGNVLSASQAAMLRRDAQTLVARERSDLGGFTNVTFALKGDGVWTRMKHEGGPHRVQRVPVTESQGRVHTSSATVTVLPEAEEVDIQIPERDLQIDVYRSSGPGGQSVNTTDSAVRVTHKPTGLVVAIQDQKSQLQNKDKALRVLRSRLLQIEEDKRSSERSEARRDQVGGGGRSEKIRTYNFKENRVTDHRINLTLYKLDRVLAGELDEIVDALVADERRRQLEAE